MYLLTAGHLVKLLPEGKYIEIGTKKHILDAKVFALYNSGQIFMCISLTVAVRWVGRTIFVFSILPWPK